MYSWDGKSIFMRNMLVKPTHRLKGTGKLIFEELMKHARETGCHRIEFLVPEWNPAKEFYKKMGAVNYTVRTGYEYYRLNRETIDQCGHSEEWYQTESPNKSIRISFPSTIYLMALIPSENKVDKTNKTPNDFSIYSTYCSPSQQTNKSVKCSKWRWNLFQIAWQMTWYLRNLDKK